MKYLAMFLALSGCSSNSETPIPIESVPPVPSVPSDPSDSAPTLSDAGLSESSVPTSPSPEASSPHCGDTNRPKCLLNEGCRSNADCASNICNYAGACISTKSCINHFGGDTCGFSEVGSPGAVHESCCVTLVVPGYQDSAHPGKDVYLDKYEITAGRIRAFIADISKMNGKPDVKSWIQNNKPLIWNDGWSAYLPSSADGDSIIIPRLLLGDPRHDGQTPAQAGPGVIIPPTTDQSVSLGLNHQFSGQVYADVHGNNCGTFNGSYGFPTYYYPSDIMIKNGEVPRVSSQDLLDVKAMNCITNAMLVAFCAWDGGQLMTSDIFDFVTESPARSDAVSGCGSQYDNHGALLGNDFSGTVQSGGKCPDVISINATFDAGDNLPVPGSFLNKHIYSYPDVGPGTSDKVWQIAAPGRVTSDNTKGWMDLAGNLSEAVFDASTGNFGLKSRGIGYGSARSDLNATLMPGETILRLQRPEVKSALSGGRCVRFK